MDIRWKNNRDFEDLKDLVMHRESETWEDFIQSRKKEGRIKRTILLGQRIVELRNQAWIILFNRIRNLWEIGEILFDGKIILSFKKTLSKYDNQIFAVPYQKRSLFNLDKLFLQQDDKKIKHDKTSSCSKILSRHRIL